MLWGSGFHLATFLFCSAAVCHPVPQQTVKVLSEVCRAAGFLPLKNTRVRKFLYGVLALVVPSLGTEDGGGGGAGE